MYRNEKISLIIPCRNEEKSIPKIFKKVPKFIDEIIIVDNGSSDNTVRVAKELGLKVILEKKSHHGIGYGYAYQAGFKKATGDILITMDGDDTYPIVGINKIIDKIIDDEVDFISCSRYPLRNASSVSKIRQFGVKILNAQTSVLFNFNIGDILSGMWVVRKPIIRKLNLKSGGWNLSPEIKLSAILNENIVFKEVKINHFYRYEGKSKQKIFLTGLDHFIFIFHYRLLDVVKKVRIKFIAVKEYITQFMPLSSIFENIFSK